MKNEKCKMKNDGIVFLGSMLTGGAEWDMGAFGELFHRLGAMIPVGEVVHNVGYRSDDGDVRFFGVEVQSADVVPDGLVAWQLLDDRWTVHHADGNSFSGKLNWTWRGAWQAAGEFSAEWSDGRILSFEMTTNASFESGKSPDDDVLLVDYDPSWPKQFAELSSRLETLLGPEIALRIEHYGSTAIPGMPAKPVIDILVEIPSFEEARGRAIPALCGPSCEFWAYSGHLIFIEREKPMGRRIAHYHMAPRGHDLWQGIEFRDLLRADPDAARRYAELKRDLAERFRNDREAYTEAKGEFVRSVVS